MSKSYTLLAALLLIAFYSCTSEDETPAEDTTSPIVGISIAGIPNSGSGEKIVVGGQVVINVDAEDAGGIALIEAFIDGEKVGEDKVAPYSIILNLTSYASKAGKSEVFIDYNLKVVATDLAGNTSSVEQTINIDSQLPVITDVSLQAGAVIHGDENEVVFQVMDNKVIESVALYLNDNLSATFDDTTYAYIINSTELSDGANTLKIEAKDLAGNTGIHVVQFVVDNTGPEISLEGIEDGHVFDEATRLEPLITDPYSEVGLVEIYLGEELLYSLENTSEINFDFEPENYPVGDIVLKIRALDNLGNTSEKAFDVQILRLLLKLSIPQGYLSPNIPTNHFVFASEMDGTAIDVKEIIFETREVRLHSTQEFAMDKDFTVTFASLGSNGVASYLVSVAHINRQNFDQLNLIIPKRFSGSGATYYPINGFSDPTQLFCFGRDYYFSSSEAGDTLIQNFVPSNHSTPSGPVYIYGFNPQNNFYNFQLVDRPFPANFEINFEDFSDQNLVQKQVTTNPTAFMNSNSRSLSVFGYLSEEDKDDDLFHQLWSYGYGANIITPFNYVTNPQFSDFAHELVIGNYVSKGIGLPEETVEIPNWDIAYSFQNNTASLTKSGAGHSVGELYLDGGYDQNSPYQWEVLFDSNKDNEVVLPNIPATLSDYPLFTLYQNDNLELGRAGLRAYDGMATYEEFLDQVIKTNQALRRATPRYISIFSGTTPQAFSNPDYFYNWW